MKNFSLLGLLLFCGSAILGNLRLSAQTTVAPNNKNEVSLLAPKDGFYLVESPNDCQIGKRYVFGSSILSPTQAILSQEDDRENRKVEPIAATIVNGDAIFSVPKQAIWQYEADESGNTHLVNAHTLQRMAVWEYAHQKTKKNKVNDVFTVKNNNREPNISTRMLFETFPLNDIQYRTCDSPQWFGLSFYEKSLSRQRVYVEWTDGAESYNFKKYNNPTAGAYVEDKTNEISPTRVFCFFAQGEALPSTYVATQRIRFSSPGYRTFYAPHAYKIPENVKAYYAQRKGLQLNLYPISKTIPACTAVILYKAVAGDVELQLTFEDTPPLEARNDLRGTRRDISIEEVDASRFQYLGLTVEADAPDDWYFARIKSNIPKGKAVLVEENAQGKQSHTQALSFIVHESAPTSAASTTKTNSSHATKPAMRYDLQGLPLLYPHKGDVYIQNGKIRIME